MVFIIAIPFPLPEVQPSAYVLLWTESIYRLKLEYDFLINTYNTNMAVYGTSTPQYI